MKRRALLIGNSRGLQGVKKDIINFQKFLTGKYGGAWRNEEITRMMNPSKKTLLLEISKIKAERYDYVIVLFSGHGGYQRSTILEINGNGEVISDTELFGLSPRQLSIFDCCRAIENYDLAMESLNERQLFSVTDSLDGIRERYENRIMQSLPYQYKLYACKIGQCAYDCEDGSGAYYLKNLIKQAQSITTPYGLVGDVHEDAAKATFLQVLIDKKEYQNPVSSVSKYLSTQQLILSLKP